MRCFAHAFNTDLNLLKVKEMLAPQYVLTEHEEVVHFQVNNTGEPTQATFVFIFAFGTVVFWGLTEPQEANILTQLKSCQGKLLGGIDDDTYEYNYGETAKIEGDNITLPNHDVLTKLACSYGIAQSAKLGGFEATIQSTIELTRSLPETLAKEGKIHLSRKEIRKLIGKIFIDRNLINLHLELLDTPEFFWEHTELEPLYHLVVEYMDQENRVTVMNQRLEVMQELLDILNNELNHHHSSKLEWIIIILIFVEIVILLAEKLV